MESNKNIKVLLEGWREYLYNDINVKSDKSLLNEAYKLKDFVERIKQKWSTDDSLDSSIDLIRQHHKELVNYQNVLLQDLVESDSSLSLLERISVCILHSKTKFNSLKQEDKSDLISGNYSIIDLDYDIQDSGEKSGITKAVSDYIMNNPTNAKIVYKDENIVAVKPLNIVGSMAWAHGMYDGTREKDAPRGVKGPKITWCTAKTGKANLFEDYYERDKINLYYIVKNNNIFRGDDEFRKVCIGFKAYKNRIEPELNGGASVDAFNDDICGEYVTDNFYNRLKSELTSNSTPELSESYSMALEKIKEDASSDPRLLEDANNFIWDKNNFIHFAKKSLYSVDSEDPNLNVIDFGSYESSGIMIKSPEAYEKLKNEIKEFVDNLKSENKNSTIVECLKLVIDEIKLCEMNVITTIPGESDVVSKIRKFNSSLGLHLFTLLFKSRAILDLYNQYPIIKSDVQCKTSLNYLTDEVEGEIEELSRSDDGFGVTYSFDDFIDSQEDKNLCIGIIDKILENLETVSPLSDKFKNIVYKKIKSSSKKEEMSPEEEEEYYRKLKDDLMGDDEDLYDDFEIPSYDDFDFGDDY